MADVDGVSSAAAVVGGGFGGEGTRGQEATSSSAYAFLFFRGRIWIYLKVFKLSRADLEILAAGETKFEISLFERKGENINFSPL